MPGLVVASMIVASLMVAGLLVAGLPVFRLMLTFCDMMPPVTMPSVPLTGGVGVVQIVVRGTVRGTFAVDVRTGMRIRVIQQRAMGALIIQREAVRRRFIFILRMGVIRSLAVHMINNRGSGKPKARHHQ